MDNLRCVVERITYQNDENGFSVIKCRAKGYSDLVTVVGNMPDAHVGSFLAVERGMACGRQIWQRVCSQEVGGDSAC